MTAVLYVILDHFCIVWHFVDVYTIFILYSTFCIHAAALIILLMLFGLLFTALQMSRSNLAILSFVFQSLASGFNYFIVNCCDFFMA